MDCVLRALAYGEEVSLTLADTTDLVKEGVKLHKLEGAAAKLFGRALSLAVFQGACLKGEKGEMSFSLRSDGFGGEICASIDQRLNVRGYLQNGEGNGDLSEAELLGNEGSLTVIRQDGYSRPFVGTSALIEGDIDAQFVSYYEVSEQLPTHLATIVRLDETGGVAYAGLIALQPLPFISQKTLDKMPTGESLSALLPQLEGKDVEEIAAKLFGELQSVRIRMPRYQCRCSKEYLGEVLVSLGEAQMREIIREDGAVRVHCHYCNKDYEFLDEDADLLFSADGRVS